MVYDRALRMFVEALSRICTLGYGSLNMDFSKHSPDQWLNTELSPQHIAALTAFLTEQGTFSFSCLPSGLFPAAAGLGEEFELTGYRNVWVRDNVHVAYAHWRVGKTDVAVRCIRALADYFLRHQHRFQNIIDGSASHDDPMHRPHIRFNGQELQENPEKWSHAQNDALGFFLALYANLVHAELISENEVNWELVSLFVHYFDAVKYWEDEDSGHWEETRKISASSVGLAKEGLLYWGELLEKNVANCATHLQNASRPVNLAMVRELQRKGDTALAKILPWECAQDDPSKRRRHDGALVFLCYPFQCVDRNMFDTILDEVVENLSGEYGIRRYAGDSYWCANYKELLAPEERTADFSDNLEARDRLLQKGTEAQWCIFDPAISCAYGSRVSKDHAKQRGFNQPVFAKQLHHLRRSLSQLTNHDDVKGPYRCPESRYLTRDGWTQGNLLQALWWMEHVLKLRENREF
jgi:Glycosyl hydrolases family 15